MKLFRRCCNTVSMVSSFYQQQYRHKMAAECEKIQIPVVVFNKYTVNNNIMTVCSDNVKAG